ncbi:uncharacterized protein LOC118274457 [Spodoptera frugiperda]|uniref:Regulatory protein zeste n=1 Tax=Spodoptera frugiperda TaxID=7108 RepID=A0A9R0EP55_SPOFR|nr:uncharacterized protein LOC118274457 [Spodoptera frugiperda]
MDPLIICKSRQRAENWTREEKNMLFHLMRESAPVIESKKTDKETNLKKGKEWLKVQKRFVTLTGRSRDVEQIKRFWIRIKRSAAHHKKSVRPKEPAASAIKTKSARELHPNSKHIRLVFKKKEIKIDKNAVGLHQPQSACQVEKKESEATNQILMQENTEQPIDLNLANFEQDMDQSHSVQLKCKPITELVGDRFVDLEPETTINEEIDANDIEMNNSKRDEDEFYYFGLSVAAQLRSMPLTHAIDLESKIQMLISNERQLQLCLNTN